MRPCVHGLRCAASHKHLRLLCASVVGRLESSGAALGEAGTWLGEACERYHNPALHDAVLQCLLPSTVSTSAL